MTSDALEAILKTLDETIFGAAESLASNANTGVVEDMQTRMRRTKRGLRHGRCEVAIGDLP